VSSTWHKDEPQFVPLAVHGAVICTKFGTGVGVADVIYFDKLLVVGLGVSIM